MIDRRHFILGGACLCSAAAAETLRPSRRLNLLGRSKIEAITPRRFNDWEEIDLTGVVQQPEEGSLAARLYSQLLARVYQQKDTGQTVMLAIAYGDTQSDLLQLHRPEACYPAFGFTLSAFQDEAIELPQSVTVPCRSMVAQAPNRIETVTYWTRVGEYLPRTNTEQKLNKLRTALDGFIPDGVLVRCSTLGDQTKDNLQLNKDFLSQLVMSIAPEHRAAFIGTSLGRRLAGVA